jgi:predicted LPLAT superfamily acyltransferase
MKTAVADLPEWRTRKEQGSALFYRAVAWLSLVLGRRAARLILPIAGLYVTLFSATSRAASKRYLNLALGRPARMADVFRHFLVFGSCMLDRVFLLNDRTDLFEFNIHGDEIINRFVASGTGCVLLGAHLGSFEALRAAGRSLAGLRVSVVMYEENARKISRVLAAINPELTREIINLGRPDSFLEIQQKLAEGRFVGILADRSLDSERLVQCPFLGRTAEFSASPFRILSILKVPVVFMVALYRGGGRYDIHFELFSEPEDPPQRPNPEMLQATVARYAERLEHYCREAPFNWFNFYDIWI